MLIIDYTIRLTVYKESSFVFSTLCKVFYVTYFAIGIFVNLRG